jgi:preprotein translocase subunit YajC
MADAAQSATEAGAAVGGTEQKPQGPPGREPSWQDFFVSPWFLILVVVWLWVFWSARKQKKKDRKRKDELGDLTKGDRIITIGRLHGTVVRLTEDTMTIKPDNNSAATLTFDRVALWKKETAGEQAEEKEAKE